MSQDQRKMTRQIDDVNVIIISNDNEIAAKANQNVRLVKYEYILVHINIIHANRNR